MNVLNLDVPGDKLTKIVFVETYRSEATSHIQADLANRAIIPQPCRILGAFTSK